MPPGDFGRTEPWTMLASIFGFELMKMIVLMTGRNSPHTLGFLVALTMALQACISVPPRNTVPEEKVDQATVPGGIAARMWGDSLPTNIKQRIEILRKQMEASGEDDVYSRERDYLSISGGGANGAFGAGLLKGWSESGNRPEMTIVTGISTGALIAPFAFLGSDYDDELELLYTTMSTSDLIKKRSLIAVSVKQVVASNSCGFRFCEVVGRHFSRAISRQCYLRCRRPVSCPA